MSNPFWEEYPNLICKRMKENKEWRYGQTLFNVLHELRPDLSEQIRGTKDDPYYAPWHEEKKFDRFWSWLTNKI